MDWRALYFGIAGIIGIIGAKGIAGIDGLMPFAFGVDVGGVRITDGGGRADEGVVGCVESTSEGA